MAMVTQGQRNVFAQGQFVEQPAVGEHQAQLPPLGQFRPAKIPGVPAQQPADARQRRQQPGGGQQQIGFAGVLPAGHHPELPRGDGPIHARQHRNGRLPQGADGHALQLENGVGAGVHNRRYRTMNPRSTSTHTITPCVTARTATRETSSRRNGWASPW